MPRTVDHEQRRAEIAEAFWRVVSRAGLHAASVRTVAAEAGWSASATRHYFASQDELLAFAMGLVESRVRERLASLRHSGDVLTDVRAALYQVLPLDRARREDNEVWLALSTRAQVEPSLRAVRRRVHAALRKLAESAIGSLAGAGALAPEHNLEAETDRLHALIDGLAVHAAIAPRRMTGQRMRTVLDAHLAGLLRPDGPDAAGGVSLRR